MATQKQANRVKMIEGSKALAVGLDCHGRVEDFGLSSEVVPTTLEDRLRFAIYMGSADTINNLLSLGADANAVSDKGHSMLELADAYNPDLVELLKSYGAKERPTRNSPKSKN